LHAFKESKLMKLKLSKMNLKHDGIIDNLCEIFANNKNLINLNLSNASLNAKELNKLTLALG